MSAYELLQKYCNICIHKEKCWRPCPIVLLAMLEDWHETN